jgi:hypothetical protein
MAKYWLGVCYYYGYGVNRNIQKANELLGANFEDVILNNGVSTVSENENISITKQLDLNTDTKETTIDVTEEELYGEWTGSLLKFDWSANNIERKHPFSLEITYDSINETTVYKISSENQELTGELLKYNSTIYFEETKLKLPHNSFRGDIPNKLDYELLSSDLTIKSLEGNKYLIGGFESFIKNWNESGAPLKFVLRKKETFNNSDEELSNDVLKALSEQEDRFIKLYPNPFENDLIISYQLEKSSFIKIVLTDLSGSKSYNIETGKNQKKGKHNYFFDGSVLKKGVYVINIFVDGDKKSRILVKK